MAEDWGLCTRVRHHQQKLVLFLAAMRCHAQDLESDGWAVDYRRLDPSDGREYCQRLEQAIVDGGYEQLIHFEVEDRFMEQDLDRLVQRLGIQRNVLSSPGFLTPRRTFDDYLERHQRPFMASFYREQRQRLGVMLDLDGKPRGGKWSFDADNRRKLPADIDPPSLPGITRNKVVQTVIAEVGKHFPDHPGDAADFRWPVTRQDADRWMQDFVAHRLEGFGPFQDAITTRHDSLFHSALSPMINLGLLTPSRVLSHVLDATEGSEVPLSSLEGFVRQLIGWR
jgi:deoxyribodipyrimidine photolyase-related protein